MIAVKWKDTIYLHKEETVEHKLRRQNPTQREKDMTSWGYKFEQYMTTDSADKVPDDKEPVIEQEQFYCTLRSEFGNFSVVHTAEIDGLEISERIEVISLWKIVLRILMNNDPPPSTNQSTSFNSFWPHTGLKWLQMAKSLASLFVSIY